MSSRYMKTKVQRRCKLNKFGKKSKASRENNGTTASFPVEGPIPALRYGRPVDAASIIVPAKLLAAAAK
jgi:hypothetical protein